MKAWIASFLSLLLIPTAFAVELDNQALSQLLQREKKGMIYLWSPRMPLSEQGLAGAQQVAKELGVAFTAARDPYAGTTTDMLATSTRLIEEGALNHFPTVVLYRDGELLQHSIPGYTEQSVLKRWVKEFLSTSPLVEGARKRTSDVVQVNLTETRAYTSTKVPTWFYKVHPQGQFIAYNSGSNYLWDLQTNTELNLPGPYDPVFNIGTPTMLFPMGSGYEFYSISRMRSGDYQPILKDNTLHGVYQSTGMLSRGRDKVTFRAISEYTGGHLRRDYIYQPSTDTLTAVGESSIALCSNFRVKLPILSKDGLEMGGVDIDARKTAIFRLKDDGTCDKVEELSLKTGKLNFSYDSRYITYHIYRTDHDDYVGRPDSSTQANIYIYDRQTKKTYQLTTNVDRNSMYPEFTQTTGEVVFADYPHTGDTAAYRFFKFVLP